MTSSVVAVSPLAAVSLSSAALTAAAASVDLSPPSVAVLMSAGLSLPAAALVSVIGSGSAVTSSAAAAVSTSFKSAVSISAAVVLLPATAVSVRLSTLSDGCADELVLSQTESLSSCFTTGVDGVGAAAAAGVARLDASVFISLINASFISSSFSLFSSVSIGSGCSDRSLIFASNFEFSVLSSKISPSLAGITDEMAALRSAAAAVESRRDAATSELESRRNRGSELRRDDDFSLLESRRLAAAGDVCVLRGV